MRVTARSEHGLREGSVRFWGALAISFGNMAPAASVLFLPQAMAPYTGTAMPLAFVMAMLAAFLTASSILYFTRRFASAGAAYTFNAIAFNKIFGFLSGWMLSLAYGLALPSNLLVFGYFAQGYVKQAFGENISWFLWAVCALAIITYLVVRGIRASTRVDLVLIVIETILILALAVVIVVHGGAQGNTWAVFSPAQAPHAWVGMVFGMLYGVGAFAGFEAAATVAEETRNRYRTIPAAIFTALVLGGFLYIFVAYAIAIGYGENGTRALLASSMPLNSLAIRYVGHWMAYVIEFAGMVSALGVSLASANASARVLYTMGRDRVLPRWIEAIHPHFQTPYRAAYLMAVLSALLLIGVALLTTPYPQGFSALVAAADVLGLTLYVSVNIAWVRMWWKEPAHYHIHWIRGIVPSLLGAVVMVIPLVSTIFPMPAWPVNVVLYCTFAYVLLGWGVGLFLKAKRPYVLDRAGEPIGTEE